MNNEIGDPNNQGNISNYPIMTIFVTMLWRGGKGAKVHYKIIFFSPVQWTFPSGIDALVLTILRFAA